MNESNADEVAKNLEGFTITGGHEFVEEEDGTVWGRIHLIGPNGERAYLEPSRDPEGNGPGFCFTGERE